MKIEEIDGLSVLKQTENTNEARFGIMFFEEDDQTVEVKLTALAIVEENDSFIVFMCDEEWNVIDEQQQSSLEEAIAWCEKTFGTEEDDWK